MNFKKMIHLFIFVLFLLGTKSTFAMEDLGKLISQLETKTKKSDFHEKMKGIAEDAFFKAFHARKMDKCLVYLNQIGKYCDSYVLLQSADFISRCSSTLDDSKFFREMVREWKNENKINNEMKNAEEAKDAKRFVDCYKRLSKVKERYLNIADDQFRYEVIALLNGDPDNNVIVNYYSKKNLDTELYTAVAKDDAQHIDRLLRSGADKNARDANGFAPVHNATRWGKLNALRKLDELGADFTLKTRRGNTVLHLAAVNSYENNKVAGEIMSYLLKLCKNLIEVKTSRGWTPLHSAVGNGNLDLVILLIQAGADIKAVTNNGENIRDLAKQLGHENVMKFLSAVEFDVLN